MALAMMEDLESPFGYLFQTEQMSLEKGLKAFGKLGADAVVEELRQLDYMQVIVPKHRDDLSTDDRHQALNYLMYLKQKRCGRIKARGCADGRKQRVYKGKDETSSPTVSTKALFLSCIIDAQEGRQVATVDIPGACTPRWTKCCICDWTGPWLSCSVRWMRRNTGHTCVMRKRSQCCTFSSCERSTGLSRLPYCSGSTCPLS